MTKIILANTDMATTQALAERVRALRPAWDLTCATSGHAVLQQSINEHVNCVITDVTLDDMSGFELLSALQVRSGHTIRLTLTSELEHEVVLESARANHRFINGAVCDDVLVSAIDASLRLHSILGDESLKRSMASIRHLPTLPDVYQQMVAELTAAQSSLQRVGAIIESDASLTATVLKIVNSAFYGLNQRVESVAQAVALLGVHLIKNITLSAKVFMQFEAAEVEVQRLRRINDIANKNGALANHFARLACAPRSVVDHAQIAGMLADVGQLIALLKTESVDCTNFDLTGAHLLSQWLMPDPVVEAIALQDESPPVENVSITPLIVLHAVRYVTSHLPDINDSGRKSQCLEYLQAIVSPELAEQWLEAYCDLEQLTGLGGKSDLKNAA